ncbi:MAG TPA: response regulator [Gammaproteobacteria bacterium]|nr:response regulator [Gammaproteobacteria bacterium]
MKTILVVEDEAPIRDVLRFSLERAGYLVEGAASGRNALRELDNYVPDLIVLDVGLPDIDGLELLHNWRREERTRSMPVIIVTGRSDERDRVSGLRAGADDYVTKPFSRDELLARIETVFRRVSPSETKEVIEISGLRLDSASIRVTAKDKPVRLGPLEFRLLRHFMAQPNRVHTRDEIIDRVWRSKEYVDPRAVDVQIRRLRRLLEDVGYAECIQTVRGIGYRFAEQN